MLLILIDLGGVYMPNRVWYISDFFEEISKEQKNQNHIENLSIHLNTVDNWFKRMEKEKINFVNRDNLQMRIYDDTDLKIACYLYNETKINKESIGSIFRFKFTNVKTRSYDEAKLNIFETNKEVANFSDIWSEKCADKEESSTSVKWNELNSKPGNSLELTEVLKKEITFNGQKLTSTEKQRIVDFLSGLVWPINYL